MGYSLGSASGSKGKRMLGETEKKNLYIVIKTYLGEDAVIKSRMDKFSNQTLEVVEVMIARHGKCNMLIQELITRLIGASKIPVSNGWLKRILGALSKELKTGKFNTRACRNVLHSSFRSPILETTYG